MDPFVAGRQMDTDEIVEVSALRDWLAALVEMSYQSIGHRRVKNPRIWSLHDLAVLAGAPAPARVQTGRVEAAALAPAPGRDAARAAATSGSIAIRAPSSGRFWARPSPDKPAFVSAGDVVTTGQTVCLLEVMKTFHRVTYSGEGLPPKARVLAVRPSDGDDLAAGDVLIELEPA
jgi:biotin carboxyl carrier protein